jgi:hypothetical protein
MFRHAVCSSVSHAMDVNVHPWITEPSLSSSISPKIFWKEETLNSQNQYFSNRKGDMYTGRKELNPISTLAFTDAWNSDRARDA